MTDNWFMGLQVPTSTPTQTTTTARATWNAYQTDVGNYWSYKTTEIKMDSEAAAAFENAVITGSVGSTTSVNDCTTTAGTTTSSVSESKYSEGES